MGNHSWLLTNSSVYEAFDADEQKSVLDLFPELLQTYRVLIYTGNMDLNCNVLGVETYIQELSGAWSGYDEYVNRRDLFLPDPQLRSTCLASTEPIEFYGK